MIKIFCQTTITNLINIVVGVPQGSNNYANNKHVLLLALSSQIIRFQGTHAERFAVRVLRNSPPPKFVLTIRNRATVIVGLLFSFPCKVSGGVKC